MIEKYGKILRSARMSTLLSELRIALFVAAFLSLKPSTHYSPVIFTVCAAIAYVVQKLSECTNEVHNEDNAPEEPPKLNRRPSKLEITKEQVKAELEDRINLRVSKLKR